MDERNQVADRLHSAAIHVLRRAAEEDRAAGLSRARLSALSVVVFRGPLTLGELAAAEGVRSATMSGIVNGLERDGLVRRRPHGRDRRSVSIEPTPKGRRLLDRARASRIERIASRLDDLSAEELDVLARAAALLEARFSRR
ncbi:MAG TPA: SMC-Scp complex subunit ScpB [Gaiellaceae bacterium]|nr:SMC-Scp complex subunit ScpB [Gaiellaceae bacterium]